VSSGGTTSGTGVNGGGAELVTPGGTAIGTTVGTGGYLVILPGGGQTGTMLSGGAIVSTGIVLDQPNSGVAVYGNVAADLVVSRGGAEYVLLSGTASGTVVNFNAVEDVFSGGTASSTMVNGGGTENVGGTANFTAVSFGGFQVVSSGGTASGTVVNDGGTQVVSAGATASGTVLLLGGAIDLPGLAYAGSGSAALDPTTDILTVTEGSFTYTQHLPGTYTGESFFTARDSGGGTLVTVESAPCYCRGTLILTDRGEVAVEGLRQGDRLLAHGGNGRMALFPIVWIGHRSVDCRRHPKPELVWPVRIVAGAFGRGRPRRDLWLSPDHAVFVDGVLIPIRYLINGATVAQVPTAAVKYFHVELPTHAVLLAEGLPAESYLDTGNRSAFANGGTVGDGEGAAPTVMHPDFALRIWETKACAPLVVAGAELVAARSVLLERAEILGHATTRDAAMRLVVDGRVAPPKINGSIYRFHLPATARSIRLVSRRAIPAHMRPDSDDYRPLGVAVSRVALDGREVPLTDPRLGSGWHGAEVGNGTAPGWRWTDGDAALAVAGVRLLEIEVAITARYWLSPGSAEAIVA
jgi:autotransporter passenger strand-loop-strand repeat protein